MNFFMAMVFIWTLLNLEKNKNFINYILNKTHKYKKTNFSLQSYFLYMNIEEYFKKLRKLSSFDNNEILNSWFYERN